MGFARDDTDSWRVTRIDHLRGLMAKTKAQKKTTAVSVRETVLSVHQITQHFSFERLVADMDQLYARLLKSVN
jgi:hypothetical protein